MPLRAPDTRRVAGGIVVRPRFGWDGIGQLLQEIGWSASPTLLEMPLVPGAAREVPPWVLAGPILQRLERLLRDVKRDFHLVEEVRQSPRGQVLWGRYVSEQMARGAFHQLPCRFPELGPDALLRAYLRWGIERVYRSLIPFGAADVIARQLAAVAEGLLFELRDVPVRAPDRRTMNQIMGMVAAGLPSEVLRRGLQALGWIMDERGLAGTAESDGLAWSLPMHQLFERWVEHLVRLWARGFGGDVRTAREAETVIPIQWSRGAHRSLGSLVPDLVVRHGDRAWVIDAKYKGHFEELDEERWAELAAEIQEDHRHDLHQVLAYAGLFDGASVTAVLAYPMRLEAWERLTQRDGTTIRATITTGGREVGLALVGVPLQMRSDLGARALAGVWLGVWG
ncbi:MAG: 5-methylcytosine restriction system specificity protein McrC [Bacillota bacterium]